MNFEFTDAERYATIQALRLAAERYDEHAKAMREAKHPHLVEQFELQAVAARELIVKLEEAE